MFETDTSLVEGSLTFVYLMVFPVMTKALSPSTVPSPNRRGRGARPLCCDHTWPEALRALVAGAATHKVVPVKYGMMFRGSSMVISETIVAIPEVA